MAGIPRAQKHEGWKIKHGGWEMELDTIAYEPKSGALVHYEPSIDALPWHKRESRYAKKFAAARKYIFEEVFKWLPPTTPIEQIAVFITHPKNRHTIAGGRMLSIDELMAQIRVKVISCGSYG